jgi:CubicO group peptidase (beta-lactamase class C family)
MVSQSAVPNLSGSCDPDWEEVRQSFVENFQTGAELGASLCVHLEGDIMVDLAAGWADLQRTVPWTADTLSVVFSCTKAAVALCAHLLIDRGEMELHAPVRRYWPEFATNGKDSVTVAMLLDHSAGVPGFREPLKQDAYLDWNYMVRRLEQEAPFWEPGTRQGYHAITFGWTVGELVRRVSGRRLGAFFRSEIGEPLRLDFWIGLPSDEEHRVAAMLPPIPDPTIPVPPIMRNAIEHPESLSALALANQGGATLFPPGPEERCSFDTPAYHAAEIGGAGGISNARGLAGMYRALANRGSGLISEKQIRAMSQVSMSSHSDAITLAPTRYAYGFMKRVDCRYLPGGDASSFLIGDRAFGHPGAGGSLGFADPDCGLSLGYSLNRMGATGPMDPRTQRLVDAVYRCVGVANRD